MTTARITSARKTLEGTVELPSSKSISNRLLMIRAISRQGFRIHRLSDAGDTRLLDRMLSRISHHQGSADPLVMDINNAGTVLRFLTAFLSTLSGEWVLTGAARMQQRPLQPLVDALISLGADIRYTGEKGVPPVIIRGGDLRGGEVTVDASVSSQFVSALLLIAPSLPEGMTINLNGLQASNSYITMTVKLMQEYGIRVDTTPDAIRVFPGRYSGQPAVVEADWSSAAFWYEAAVLSEKARLILPGLMSESLQGDAVAVELFKKPGVITHFTNEGALLYSNRAERRANLDYSVGVPPPPRMQGTHQESTSDMRFDFLSCPDLAVPALVAWGFSGRAGTFSGLQNLVVKESDRFTALLEAFQRAHVPVTSYASRGVITLPGWDPATGGIPGNLFLDTHDDHRLAMAFAMLAVSLGSLEISHPRSVSKSYPGFWDQFDNIIR